MAAVRVGINGFGRIGRLVFRVMASRPDEFEVAVREKPFALSRIVIVAFNPWSLWGLRGAIGPARNDFPWNGRFVSLPRVKDWLGLLGFDVSAGRLIGYAPPFDSEKWRRRFGFMEPAGDRWWAVGGAVYMLQAIKRVRGMRLITPAWQERAAREKPLAAAAKRQGHIKHGHLKIVK